MSEPARKIEDEQEHIGYKSPLEQARESWGEASVISNDEVDSADRQERDALSRKEPRISGVSESQSSVQQKEKDEVFAASGVGADSMNYTGENTEKSKTSRALGVLTKRKSVAALLGGGGLSGVIVAGFMAAQPFQVVHFAQVLNQFHFFSQEDAGDSRNGRFMQYFRKHPSRGNHGILGNRIADRFEKKLTSTGVDFSFENPNTPGQNMATVQTMKVDLDNPKAQNVISDLEKRGVQINPDGTVRLRGAGSSKAARQAIRSTVREAGYGKISGAMRSRVLIKRAGVNFSPLNNFLREKGESLSDYRKRRSEKRATEVRNGAESPEFTARGEANVDENGETTPNTENDRVASEATESFRNAEADVDAEVSRLRSKVTRNVGVASGLVALACTAREVNAKAGILQYENVVVPLMRFAWEFKATASNVMLGQRVVDGQPTFNMDEVSEMTERLSEVVEKVELDNNDQPVKTGETYISTWQQAESIRAEQGQAGGIPPEEIIKPGDDPKSIPFTAWIDSIKGISLACSTAGGFILTGVELVVGVATGGAATVATQAIKSAILQGGMKAAGIDPLNTFIEWIARKTVGAEIDVDKKGANAGNMANFGERLAANNVAIASGGSKLTTKQVRELDKEKDVAIRLDLKNKSFFARMLDLKEPNSVASLALLRSGNFISKDTTIAWVKQLPLTSLRSPSQNVASAFTQRTYASSNYDYGFSEYGFTQEELDSERYEDPYANAEIVEANIHGKGGRWDEEFSECFGVSVAETGALVVADKSYYEIPDLCSDRDNEDLTRYRFYLLDTLTVKTMECYEGIDNTACAEIGFGGNTQSSQPGNTTDKPIAGNTFNTPCAPGTEDVSGSTPTKGYQDGNPYDIRICSIPNIQSTDGRLTARVNSVTSQKFLDLSNAAAAAGHRLVFNGEYSTFRTMEQQEFLCNDNPASCAAGFTAQPGHSNHQMGFAIDFNFDGYGTGSDNLGGRCKTAKAVGKRCELGESATWRWMRDNAGTYGISQLDFEYWHWGTNESNL